MVQTDSYIKTVVNPAGLIEQEFVGSQTPQEILAAIKEIGSQARKLEKSGKPVLILVDLSRVTNIDLSKNTRGARMAGLRAMRSVKFVRAAICGSPTIQVLVSTLSLVAGVHAKVKVFNNRADALEWLNSA